MKLDFCAVCGSKEDLNYHHFTPKICGGTNDETNILTLCYHHHREIHGNNYTQKINHSELTKLGLKKAKERGVKLGSPTINLELLSKSRTEKALKEARKYKNIILSMRSDGYSYAAISANLSIPRSKIHRWCTTYYQTELK